MNTATRTTKDEGDITGLCFTASNSISLMTGDLEEAEHSHFDNLPLEIIEVIGSFLTDLKDTAALCQTCQRIRAISMDKLRLYDPKFRIGSSEVDHLLRKWKIPKFNLTKGITSEQLNEMDSEGFYFDPNELLEWAEDKESISTYVIYESKSLFFRILKAVDFDPSDYDNFAIRMASKFGQLQVVKLLLEKKHLEDFERNYEIKMASQGGPVRGYFDPSAKDNEAIRYASTNGHVELVKLLLEDERIDPSATANEPIREAAYLGHSKVVKVLLADKRVDPSAIDNYAVRMASYFGHLEIVQLLLADKRVDPSAGDNFAIIWSSFHGHLEIVRLLLSDTRIDPSVGDNGAIVYASAYGHIEVVKLLLNDERVNPLPSEYNFAINKASERGHLEIVKLLLTYERVHLSYKISSSIRRASQYGHLEIVKFLLADERIDPSAHKNQAIKLASRNGHLEVVKLLLSDERVDPSAYDNDSLRKACQNGHLEVVKLLLAHGVDPSAGDDSPIKLATDSNNLEIVKLLLSHQKLRLEQEDLVRISLSFSMENEIMDLLQKYESSPKDCGATKSEC